MSSKTEIDSLRSREKDFTLKEKESCKDAREVQVDKSYHKLRDSLFSSSAFSSMNNWGISNICLVLLISSNACLVLENISNFGIFINPLLWIKIYFAKLTEMSAVYILSGLNLFVLSSLGLEVLRSKGILNNKVFLTFTFLLLICEILVPPFVLHTIDSFSTAFTIVVCYITVFLKLISYHMVNYWSRQKITTKTLQHNVLTNQNFKNGDAVKDLIHYPDNLKVKDIYYFLFAPTLCYDLNFPLLPHVRKSFLIKRILELLFVLSLIISILQQLIIPVVLHYQDSFQTLDYIKIFEIYMKFTIPFYTIWILSFYFIFHLWLNVIGEISRFGDRMFYEDWWNAETMAVWWRKWNIPVHKWCLRHMYQPLLQSGYTKFQAVSAVFFVSAIFHEYLFCLPLKIFRTIMFIGIFFGQMSYFAFSSNQPSKYSNIGLCLNCFLSQPFLLLYYYYGYYTEHVQNLKVNL